MTPASQPTDINHISTSCPYCGGSHATTCHLIKAIEYHANGAIKRVEFKTAHDWPQQVSTQQVYPYQNPIISSAAGFLA